MIKYKYLDEVICVDKIFLLVRCYWMVDNIISSYDDLLQIEEGVAWLELAELRFQKTVK